MSRICLLMHTQSHARVVYYSWLCGKFIVVYSAAVSQTDIFLFKQNISTLDTGNCANMKEHDQQEILNLQLF